MLYGAIAKLGEEYRKYLLKPLGRAARQALLNTGCAPWLRSAWVVVNHKESM